MQQSQPAMKVLFHGKLSDSFGPAVEVPSRAPCTVAELRRQLVAGNPDAAAALQDKRVRAFVGDTLVGDTHPLAPDDEVEFLAPVSGG